MRACTVPVRRLSGATAAAPRGHRAPLRFPSVGKLLLDRGLDRASVTASGRLGQLLKGDVLRAKQPPPPAPQQAVEFSGTGKAVPHRYAFREAPVGPLLQGAAGLLGPGGLGPCLLRCAAASLSLAGLERSGTARLERVTRGATQRATVPVTARPEEAMKALSAASGPAASAPVLILQDYSEAGLSNVTGVLPPGAALLLAVGAPALRCGPDGVAGTACVLSLTADATRVDEEQAQQFLEGVATQMKSFGI
jgi:pyruvate/2-oxoglutarate dehydrogenase complex dihydrolipoamide acyltransferase (E2) component